MLYHEFPATHVREVPRRLPVPDAAAAIVVPRLVVREVVVVVVVAAVLELVHAVEAQAAEVGPDAPRRAQDVRPELVPRLPEPVAAVLAERRGPRVVAALDRDEGEFVVVEVVQKGGERPLAVREREEGFDPRI